MADKKNIGNLGADAYKKQEDAFKHELKKTILIEDGNYSNTFLGFVEQITASTVDKIKKANTVTELQSYRSLFDTDIAKIKTEFGISEILGGAGFFTKASDTFHECINRINVEYTKKISFFKKELPKYSKKYNEQMVLIAKESDRLKKELNTADANKAEKIKKALAQLKNITDSCVTLNTEFERNKDKVTDDNLDDFIKDSLKESNKLNDVIKNYNDEFKGLSSLRSKIEDETTKDIEKIINRFLKNQRKELLENSKSFKDIMSESGGFLKINEAGRKWGKQLGTKWRKWLNRRVGIFTEISDSQKRLVDEANELYGEELDEQVKGGANPEEANTKAKLFDKTLRQWIRESNKKEKYLTESDVRTKIDDIKQRIDGKERGKVATPMASNIPEIKTENEAIDIPEKIDIPERNEESKESENIDKSKPDKKWSALMDQNGEDVLRNKSENNYKINTDFNDAEKSQSTTEKAPSIAFMTNKRKNDPLYKEAIKIEKNTRKLPEILEFLEESEEDRNAKRKNESNDISSDLNINNATKNKKNGRGGPGEDGEPEDESEDKKGGGIWDTAGDVLKYEMLRKLGIKFVKKYGSKAKDLWNKGKYGVANTTMKYGSKIANVGGSMLKTATSLPAMIATNGMDSGRGDLADEMNFDYTDPQQRTSYFGALKYIKSKYKIKEDDDILYNEKILKEFKNEFQKAKMGEGKYDIKNYSLEDIQKPGESKVNKFEKGGEWKVTGENGIEIEKISSDGKSGKVLSPLNKTNEHRQSLKDVIKEAYEESGQKSNMINPNQIKTENISMYERIIKPFEKMISGKNKEQNSPIITNINTSNNMANNASQQPQKEYITTEVDFVRYST